MQAVHQKLQLRHQPEEAPLAVPHQGRKIRQDQVRHCGREAGKTSQLGFKLGCEKGINEVSSLQALMAKVILVARRGLFCFN